MDLFVKSRPSHLASVMRGHGIKTAYLKDISNLFCLNLNCFAFGGGPLFWGGGLHVKRVGFYCMFCEKFLIYLGVEAMQVKVM